MVCLNGYINHKWAIFQCHLRRETSGHWWLWAAAQRMEQRRLSRNRWRDPRWLLENSFHMHGLFTYMGIDQYLLIPFLVGWTSIYQLFLCSPGVEGFDTLPYAPCMVYLPTFRWFRVFLVAKIPKHCAMEHLSFEICPLMYLSIMRIFHSYVGLPEGIGSYKIKGFTMF